jgi:chromosome segregation ATPase
VNELTTININLSSSKAKLEQEYSALQGDYDELSKELRLADDRFQKATSELKHTVDVLHEEQERIVKIESIKKSLEIEVKNLTIRLEEVEANALIGGKRIISKLEARVKDIELELDEEKRRHAETIKILRKKERQVKEIIIQAEEDRKNAMVATEQVDKLTEKIKMYKRQLNETESMSQSSVTRVRRFQRELEAAEERADSAESNLTMIRAKHRTFVTAIPGGTQSTFLMEEHRTTHESH